MHYLHKNYLNLYEMVKISRLINNNLTSYIVFHPSILYLFGDCSKVTLIIKNLITKIMGTESVQLWLSNNLVVHLPIQAVLDFHTQFIPKNVYESQSTDLYVIKWVPFLLLKKYIKIPIYVQPTKQL
jgi:hypothetical protein